MTVTNLVAPALAAADQFIIGSIVGIVAVAHFAVPMSLVQRSNAIPVAFGRTFFPRMSSLSGEDSRVLAERALATMGYGFAAVCAPAIILSPTLLRYWIGAVSRFRPGPWLKFSSLECGCGRRPSSLLLSCKARAGQMSQASCTWPRPCRFSALFGF